MRLHRFGRQLLSYESAVPQYLLPKTLSPLCHGADCCQEDDYTSAFQVRCSAARVGPHATGARAKQSGAAQRREEASAAVHACSAQVMMLNSSRAVFGGRSYTTFFMNLQRSFTCNADIDTAGCCNANVSTIWIDVGEPQARRTARARATSWPAPRRRPVAATSPEPARAPPSHCCAARRPGPEGGVHDAQRAALGRRHAGLVRLPPHHHARAVPRPPTL